MTLTYIVAAVVLLGLCIFIHELGHLLGGRMVGIRAKIFSLGYGKGVLKKQIGETTYQVTLIPLGGYCQFYGEDPSEERKGEAYEFLSAHPLKRIVAVVMGPLFNLFFGIILFFSMNMIGYKTETNQIYIPEYFKSGDYISPAFEAGIKSGDRITGINNKKVVGFSEIQSRTVFSEGNPMPVRVERKGETHEFVVKPRKFAANGHYTIGVMPYGERVLVVQAIENDVADKAGIETFDEIKSVNGMPVREPIDFTGIIRRSAGKDVSLLLVRSGKERTITVKPRQREVLTIKRFEDARFRGERHDITVDKIDLLKNAISLKKVKINGRIISSFREFEEVLRVSAGKEIRIENSGGVYAGVAEFERYGFIGVETAVAPEMIAVTYGVGEGLLKAFVEPYDFVVMNLKGMGMLIAGKLDVRENLSGPIRIAKISGDTLYYRGVSAFILLMAKISIILMVMNLLPIPAVDGSHILFYLFEMVRGKPLNEKVMEKIQFVGFALLILLGVFVIFNDLSFLPFFQRLFN